MATSESPMTHQLIFVDFVVYIVLNLLFLSTYFVNLLTGILKVAFHRCIYGILTTALLGLCS